MSMGNQSSSTTDSVLKRIQDSTDGPSQLTRSTNLYRRNSAQRIHRRRRSQTLSGEFAMSRKLSSWKNNQRRQKTEQWLAMEKEKRTTEGKQELFAAVIRGDEEAVCNLLTHGVDVNATDGNYLTALHYAAMHARPNMIELLIQYGANVDAYDMKGGFSPLHWVVINSHPGMSDEQRVDESLLALVKGGCNVNSKDFNQATPLHFAARTDNKPAVDALMRLGANPNEVDVLGRTCAAVAKSSETKILIIKLADLRARAFYHVLEIPAV